MAEEHKELIEKAGQIIKERSGHGAGPDAQFYCALGLIDLDGSPTVSAITAAKNDGIRWITFDTGLASNKAKRIANNNRASLCFCSNAYNITLVGSMEVLTDPDVKKEMWYAGMGYHFSGPEDEGYCVLKFTTERYNIFIDGTEAVGEM